MILTHDKKLLSSTLAYRYGVSISSGLTVAYVFGAKLRTAERPLNASK
jgi:hypothetical protein